MKKFSLVLISLGIVMLFGCASTQSVKDLEARVDQNAAMIGQNTAIIGQNTADIEALETQLEEAFTRSMSK